MTLGRLALAGVCLLAAALASAQQRTNRDQSGYTELHEEGFPIKSGLRIVAPGQAKLADADLVIGIVIGTQARAYPVNLMWEPQNEALNDRLAGVDIVATWCPIAHSAVVFERRLGGRTLELGALGLEEGVFKLYDRQTRSSWSQISGSASRGPLRGRELRKRESLLTSWGKWRQMHPETTVYFDPALPDRHPFNEDTIARITLAGDGPLRNEDLVAGVEGKGGSRAWLLRRLAAARVLNDATHGNPVVVFLAEDAVTVRVMGRSVGGRVLTFAVQRDRLHDAETGSEWDALTGRAMSGPLAGRRLASLVVTTALWYAWRSQHPGTTLWGADLPGRSPSAR